MTSYIRALIAMAAMFIVGIVVVSTGQTPQAETIGVALITSGVVTFAMQFIWKPIAGDEQQSRLDDFQTSMMEEFRSMQAEQHRFQREALTKLSAIQASLETSKQKEELEAPEAVKRISGNRDKR